VSLYGVIGVSYGKIDNAQNGNHHSSNRDYCFSYGAGLQFNPIQNNVLNWVTSKAVSAVLTLASGMST